MTVEDLKAATNGGIPNNPDLPALICAGALEGGEDVARETFAENGWGGLWTWSVYEFHHWHPDSHEALACVSGWADLHLGGPDGPVKRVNAGDVLILPAGFGHKRVDASDDFAVVGAYPPGQESPEIVKADEMDMDEALSRIRAVPLPAADPVAGGDGPLKTYWG